MNRHFLLAAMLTFGAVTASAEAPFRLVLERQGTSGLDVRLEDINGHSVDVPQSSTLTLSIEKGELRRVAPKQGVWTNPYSEAVVGVLPDFEFRSTHPFWADDVTIRGMLVSQRPPVKSRPLVIGVRPHWAVGLALSIIGALLFSGLGVGQKTEPTRKTISAGAAAALIAGIVAFFAADSKVVWQVIGFKDETPLRPQSYFLLGLLLSGIGVRPLVRRLTGQSEDKETPLTVETIQDRVNVLLSGESVSKPFRDEVRAILFDPEYISNHPEFLGRVEAGLAGAKVKGKLPEGLSGHLAPRLEDVYRGSYRSNFQSRIRGTIDAAGQLIRWENSIHYEYVHNESDATQPAIKFGQSAEIPPPLRDAPEGALTSFGRIFQSVSVSLRDVSGTATLTYLGNKGKTLLRTDGSEVVAPPRIDVDFVHTPRHEVEAKFTFLFPERFVKADKVVVDIEFEYVSEIDDGVLFVTVGKLTHGYHLSLDFTPKVKLDIAAFEWKLPLSDTTRIEEDGAHLDGWLLPGNGVGIAWHGARDAVAAQNVTPRPSLVRRVLGWRPWK
jgi:hypothetical protein